MPEIHLVCEGEEDSLDLLVLNAIIGQRFGLFVTIWPGGGDAGLGSVCRHLERSAPRGARVALEIQDRNFRSREEVEVCWQDASGRKLVWRRHEIENYLLAPRVMVGAFETIRRDVGARWAQELPRDEAGAAQLLVGLAGSLLERHVAGVLSWELYLETTEGNPAAFRMPRLRDPGAARPARGDWIAALQGEARRVREACSRLCELPALEPDAIEDRYDEILARVKHPRFMDEGDYLLDMEGKQLMRMLLAHLKGRGASRLKRADLEKRLVDALEAAYQPEELFAPDDFALLRDRLENLRDSAGA